MIWFRRDRRKGQIAPFLIAVIVILLIALMVTVNLGKISLTTVKTFGLLFDLLGIDSSDLYSQVKLKGTHWMLSHDTKFNAKWRLYYDAYFDKYQSAK